MRRLLSILFVLITFSAVAQPAPPASETQEPAIRAGAPLAELSLFDALVLGAVEGLTEYLPVSSTGHLIIANHLLKLESEEPLRGPDGEMLWFKPPSENRPEGVPLTMKLAADTYVIVIQFGAIAAVALLYWKQLRSMVLGLFGKDPAGLKLLINLIVAFLPAAVIGLLIRDWIDALFSVKTVIAALVVGAFLILAAERWRKKRVLSAAPTSELSVRHALQIGILQCFAMWPGMSRSMMTIIGGYLAGLEPRRAAEFSFLLGLVTLSAATLYKSYSSGTAMIAIFGWSHVLFGCVVAAITAALAVRFLVGWLSRHGMTAFAYYRLAFAAILAALTWL